MHVEDFIIEVYCYVSDSFREITKDVKLRSRGFSPKMTDEELLTIELVGEYLGLSKDILIWSYFKNNYAKWFPSLGTRSLFVKQSANLYQIKQKMHEYFIKTMKADKSDIYIVDGFPLPVCEKARAYNSKNFKSEASYGYCASKDLKYYGFKGLFVINKDGVVVGLNIAAANKDERDILCDMPLSIKGLLLADKGFISSELTKNLLKHGIKLATPLRKNMQKSKDNIFTPLMFKTRRLVETVISQFTNRFSIQKHGAKDIWHLISRIYRKVVCHTLCIIINRKNGNNLNIAKILC